MRFDYRGMGDSSGVKCGYEEIEVDLGAAIDHFRRKIPAVDRIVLWGLCDGASAACFYAPRDPQLAGLVLLNPWVRPESSEAKTYLKHYYLKRFFDPQFWRKLWNRQVAVGDTVSNILGALRLSRTSSTGETADSSGDLPCRMAAGVEQASVPLLVVLSGNDYVANEFEVVCQEHRTWKKIMTDATVERMETADHTFSTAEWRDAVAEITANWVLENADRGPGNKPASN
jgi:exosortase A-associated hydrolase 1